MPTYWGFGLVVATLYTLLDVLVRFDATCRLEMILGSFFCDCEEVRLGVFGERSGSCEGNALFCHGGGRGKVDTGVDDSSDGVAHERVEDSQRPAPRAATFGCCGGT
jgi:hypothetical protein